MILSQRNCLKHQLMFQILFQIQLINRNLIENLYIEQDQKRIVSNYQAQQQIYTIKRKMIGYQQNEIRKRVFFKPELSTQIKFTQNIRPQFVSDSKLLYMSAYDFISYEIDDQKFTLLNRSLPETTSTKFKDQKQEFINVNFGLQTRQNFNQIFYLVKSIINEQEVFQLGRKNQHQQFPKIIIAKGKKIPVKKTTQRFINDSLNKPQQDPVSLVIVPQKIIQFKKHFLVKQNLNMIIFLVKREVQPQIKIVKKDQDKQGQLNNNQHQLNNKQHQFNSYQQQSTIFGQGSIKDKNGQNSTIMTKMSLLVHAYDTNHTFVWDLQENIQSVFQFSPSHSSIICSTQNSLHFVNIQRKQFRKQNTICDIKMQVMDQHKLAFFIKDQGNVAKGLGFDKISKNSKKKRFSSVAHNIFTNDTRISKLIFGQRSVSSKNLGKRWANASQISAISNYQVQTNIKTIKKAIYILPLCSNDQQYILIIYQISRILCSHDQVQVLNFYYQTQILSTNSQIIQNILFQQKIIKSNQNNTDNFLNDTPIIPLSNRLGQYLDEVEFKEIMEMVKEIGGVTTNNQLILIWEKNQPVFHQIIFKAEYKTLDMLDLSNPTNLKSLKSIKLSLNFSLQYRNKINLSLNSNLIKDLSISPCLNNLLILCGRSHNPMTAQHQFNELEQGNIDQKYDIQDYLIFQYDLFSELWSSDANVYLKTIQNSYKKRKIEEIKPFRLKDDVVILSGKRIHQLHRSLLQGILYFDLHPYGFYIAVSFGFSAKIYSLQHSKMNLVYTYNAQSIKKIKYSPSGNDLAIMSQKSIKIMDSFSFSIKYIIAQKSPQYSFSNFSYSSCGSHFYSIYDNIFINIQQSASYTKIGSIKPGQSEYLSTHDKILHIIPNIEEKFCVALLDNGKLYHKYQEDVVVLQHQRIYSYQDDHKINTIHYDHRRKILFCGLYNGRVRAHIWPIKNQAIYTFQNYSQFKFGYSEITSISSSYLSNTLYVGDGSGNLSISKFIIEKQMKLTGQVRPKNFLIINPNTPLLHQTKSELQTTQKRQYILSSVVQGEQNQQPQRMKLEYKLNQIIVRMNQQMKRFKIDMKHKLIQKQGFTKCKINFGPLYHQIKLKMTQLTHTIKQLKQKQDKQITTITQKYQKHLKQIVQQQNQLVKLKGLQISKNFIGRALFKMFHLKQVKQYQQKVMQIEGEYKNNQISKIKLKIQQQKLIPYDQIDYLPNQRIHMKQDYLQKLKQQFAIQSKKNMQLKQTFTYLQNSKSNLQHTSFKQQTAMFKINLELKQMQIKLQQQSGVHQEIKDQLKESQNKINKMQVKGLQRNPQFTRIINGSTDDQCTYKLWIKQKFNQEVDLLYNHWMVLADIMDHKQTHIVDMVNTKKLFTDSIKQMTQKKQKLKQYFHFLKIHSQTIKNKTNELMFDASKYQHMHQTKQQKLTNQEKTKKIRVGKKKLQKKLSIKRQKKQLDKQLLTEQNEDKILKQKEQAHKIFMKIYGNKNTSNIQQKEAIKDIQQEEVKDKIIQKQENQQKRLLSLQLQQKLTLISNQVNKKIIQSEIIRRKSKRRQSKRINTSVSRRVSLIKPLKIDIQQFEEDNQDFAIKLLQNLNQKQEAFKSNQILLAQKDQLALKNHNMLLSATSSPLLKRIYSKYNIYEKTNNYLKRNLKMAQRKKKLLNGQASELLTEFQQLKFENKNLYDHKEQVKQGIDLLNQVLDNKKNKNQIKSQNTLQNFNQTSFQRYIHNKQSKNSSINAIKDTNKSMSSTKQNWISSRDKLLTSRTPNSSSNQCLKYYASAMNTPDRTSNGISQRFQIFKI